MPVISRLSQQEGDPTRVNVFLDGKFAFSLSVDKVITGKLHIGQQLSIDEVADLTSVSDEEKIFGKIVNFISFRPRSVKEIQDRLYKYLGKDQDDLKSSVMVKLDKLGYLNDGEFAKWFVQSRVAHRPRSARHLASELYAKGISKDIIASVLAEGADERAAIRTLIEKKKNLEKDKLIAYLARRGFAWEMIKDEVDKSGAKE